MWKMLAYFATGIAVLGLMVAWQNRREVERLRAELAAQPVIEVQRPAPAAVPAARTVQARTAQVANIRTQRETAALLNELEREGYRCIDGRLFKTGPSSLEQIGRCPVP